MYGWALGRSHNKQKLSRDTRPFHPEVCWVVRATLLNACWQMTIVFARATQQILGMKSKEKGCFARPVWTGPDWNLFVGKMNVYVMVLRFFRSDGPVGRRGAWSPARASRTTRLLPARYRTLTAPSSGPVHITAKNQANSFARRRKEFAQKWKFRSDFVLVSFNGTRFQRERKTNGGRGFARKLVFSGPLCGLEPNSWKKSFVVQTKWEFQQKFTSSRTHILRQFVFFFCATQFAGISLGVKNRVSSRVWFCRDTDPSSNTSPVIPNKPHYVGENHEGSVFMMTGEGKWEIIADLKGTNRNIFGLHFCTQRTVCSCGKTGFSEAG